MGQEQHRRQGKWARSNIAARTDPNRSKDEPGPLPSRPRHHQAASKQSNTIAGTWILILHSTIVQPKHQQPPKTPHTTPKGGGGGGPRGPEEEAEPPMEPDPPGIQTTNKRKLLWKPQTPNPKQTRPWKPKRIFLETRPGLLCFTVLWRMPGRELLQTNPHLAHAFAFQPNPIRHAQGPGSLPPICLPGQG